MGFHRARESFPMGILIMEELLVEKKNKICAYILLSMYLVFVLISAVKNLDYRLLPIDIGIIVGSILVLSSSVSGWYFVVVCLVWRFVIWLSLILFNPSNWVFLGVSYFCKTKNHFIFWGVIYTILLIVLLIPSHKKMHISDTSIETVQHNESKEL